MKEDLNMYSNELVTSVSIWTVGYVIGQIRTSQLQESSCQVPFRTLLCRILLIFLAASNLLLTRVSPRWVIPSLEVGWGIATICTSRVTNYKSLYALRFLVGLFE